jgi:hypothetical protein
MLFQLGNEKLKDGGYVKNNDPCHDKIFEDTNKEYFFIQVLQFTCYLLVRNKNLILLQEYEHWTTESNFCSKTLQLSEHISIYHMVQNSFNSDSRLSNNCSKLKSGLRFKGIFNG